MTGGLNIPAQQASRAATTQQGYAAAPPASGTPQAAVSPVTDQYRSASQPIIEAEYVDLYNPIRHRPEQLNQWRNLIVERQDAPTPQAAGSDADNRNQQLVARYGQHSSDLPLPGSFINLLA
jgi:hypothetical protein